MISVGVKNDLGKLSVIKKAAKAALLIVKNCINY
jgi:hypothetical protein